MLYWLRFALCWQCVGVVCVAYWCCMGGVLVLYLVFCCCGAAVVVLALC